MPVSLFSLSLFPKFPQKLFLIRQTRRLSAGRFHDPFFSNHLDVPQRDGGAFRHMLVCTPTVSK
jgi:hypothetical protein